MSLPNGDGNGKKNTQTALKKKNSITDEKNIALQTLHVPRAPYTLRTFFALCTCSLFTST